MNKWILSKPTLARASINKVTAKQLQNIVNEILELGMSPRTAKSVKETLRPLFKQFVLQGVMQVNPAELIQIPKFNNEISIDLSDNKVKELYSALYNYPVEPFRSIFIWLSHGRRQNEILSLEWDDINLDNSTYTIRFENNKVRKPMTYKLTSELIATLDRVETRESKFIFHAQKDINKKMSKETVRNHWNKILQQMDIKIRMHDLRHLIGGTLVSSGKTLEQVASVLGHTSTSVTKRYSKVREEVAAESLDDFFKRVR